MNTIDGEWTEKPVNVYRRQKCELCSSLNDYKSTLLDDKEWEKHDHKCVKCGWHIDDLSDGLLVTYEGGFPMDSDLYKTKERYLNGYWEHYSCTSHEYKQKICPYCTEIIQGTDHYCDFG